MKDGFQNFWVEVPSNGDHMYLITFIDNFSQKSWDYFLKQKANACKNFKIFKVYVKKQNGHTITILRINRLNMTNF